ncbi:hypothetical protein NPIL_473141 [Nephila pilipes]|uniref:Uncharacterized protein n=1 Tax=Nephila pilipes TaxID=299642 RepID=A0A8X6TNL7_NEPPI|nr:hypothetical protein NPIL_473141 [Nephila pilipes]
MRLNFGVIGPESMLSACVAVIREKHGVLKGTTGGLPFGRVYARFQHSTVVDCEIYLSPLDSPFSTEARVILTAFRGRWERDGARWHSLISRVA